MIGWPPHTTVAFVGPNSGWVLPADSNLEARLARAGVKEPILWRRVSSGPGGNPPRFAMEIANRLPLLEAIGADPYAECEWVKDQNGHDRFVWKGVTV